MKPKIIIEEDKRLLKLLENLFFECGTRAVKRRGIFTVAFSGGLTPVPFFKTISRFKNNPLWKKTFIFQVDERYVPKTSVQSNFRSIQKNFLEPAHFPLQNVFAMPTESDSPQETAENYALTLQDEFRVNAETPPDFDFLLLGVGFDGHTASLFPGSEALKESSKFVVATEQSQTGQPRISLTLPVINNAENIGFLITDGPKSKVVKEILGGQSHLPAAKVLPQKGHLTFFLTPQSAGEV